MAKKLNLVCTKVLLAFAVGCGLVASPVAAEVHELCFYVEQPWSPLGVPLGPGHAFLELHDLKGTFGGARFKRGFAPRGLNIFGGAGIIRDDAAAPWHFKICFPITWVQWNAVANGVNGKIIAAPAYNLIDFNCTNWITEKAAFAGLVLPAKTNRVEVADPNVFWQSLQAIGDGGTWGGGTVTENPNPPGRSSPVGNPFCAECGFELMEAWGHQDPAGLNEMLELSLNALVLEPITADPNELVQITVSGTAPEIAIISMSWGDATPLDAQEVDFSHQYGVSGTYNATLLAVNEGAVNHYSVDVEVFEGGGPAGILVSIPPSTPISMANSCSPEDAPPVPLKPTALCGNDVVENGEQCDGADDSACPGRCTVSCTCAPPPSPGGVVPTSSEWGSMVLAIMLVILGSVMLGRQRRGHQDAFR